MRPPRVSFFLTGSVAPTVRWHLQRTRERASTVLGSLLASPVPHDSRTPGDRGCPSTSGLKLTSRRRPAFFHWTTSATGTASGQAHPLPGTNARAPRPEHRFNVIGSGVRIVPTGLRYVGSRLPSSSRTYRHHRGLPAASVLSLPFSTSPASARLVPRRVSVRPRSSTRSRKRGRTSTAPRSRT